MMDETTYLHSKTVLIALSRGHDTMNRLLTHTGLKEEEIVLALNDLQRHGYIERINHLCQ